MDSRLRSSRPTFRATSTSSGTGCRQGATFLRRCGGSIFRRQMVGHGRWAFRRLLTASPRKLPVAIWSRSWSRCFMPTPMATDPANLRSMPCARLASAVGATTGCSISISSGFFDSIDWELMLRAVRHHTDCRWVLLYIERWLKAPVQMEDGSVVPRAAGTPQGGVISPLLANLFLHYAFDTWMARTFRAHPIRAVRGRHYLSLQERRGGASPLGRDCRPLHGLQAGAASTRRRRSSTARM